MKKSFIILVTLLVIIIGIVTGVIIYEKNKDNEVRKRFYNDKVSELSKKVTDECTQEYKYLERQTELELEASSSEEKISPNAVIIFKKYYTQCEHIINEYIDIPQKLINRTKEELEKEYLNWEIKEFTSNNIVLYREFSSSCGQHYILRNDEGKITIYLINENNEEEVYEKTEISIDYLTEKDKIEIQNGIRVNGKEELNQLLEDFE